VRDETGEAVGEARFGLHTEIRSLWAKKGARLVVPKQVRYEWDYLYGSLDVVSGQAHFCHVPGVNKEWGRGYLEDLERTGSSAVHVLIRDQAGFHLKEGEELPAGIRIITLQP